MQGPGYVFIWIFLLIIPIIALWKRRWWALALYVLGCIIFLVEVMKGNGGWDDLADFATLVVIVIPIYIVATIVWVVGIIIDRKKKRSTK
ncbi:hypothetical protein [Cohnella silvisoli]|uniref:Permease n=1 Tax=Cohnella silvisoli TaxID=2873699 RepID=A0ABV1KXU4_9BACL|nr:hypothetical protein [Cohnella silvisoli]MCD9021900.1 hypothetical protein [Cohnella silvisoli]